MLLIPEFRKIWDRDISKNKEKATKQLAYVYFVADYKSEYNIYGIEKRSMISREVMEDPEYVTDDIIEEAIKKYIKLQETSSMRYLRSIRDTVDSIIKFNEALKFNSDNDTKSYNPALATKALKDVGSIVEDLEKWEKKIYGEEDQMSIRGGGKVGIFEDTEKATWMTTRQL
ncbi:MAG: hypothetical protein UR43_C0022G0005 [candidate division TM6 bacterium GW2011_GWF2_33_332]|nr:MAG: hypothetical protein UR43_C0022G0005 [candidate division TM6 bacterium GW2011_GWF2_33_332]